MKVRVQIKEYSIGFVDIEVENEEEIYGKAEEAYFAGETYWSNGDWTIKDWEELEPDEQ